MEQSRSPTIPSITNDHTNLPQDMFQHTSLDLESPSIRLIQLHSASNPGNLVHCTLRITTIDAQYTCLSYVWGDENPGQWIFIDGKRLWIRQNLSNFLLAAREVPELARQWFWIDAITIDQTNIAEREHQVQQMARIYSKANDVVAWLGKDEDIAAGIGPNAPRPIPLPAYRAIFKSPYWERAWITQELVLGSRVRFMACRNLLSLDTLEEDSNVYYNREQFTWLELHRLLDLRKRCQQQHSPLPRRSLLPLMNDMRMRKCYIARDRLFSLLGICGEGADVKVDYTISDAELAWNALWSCRRSFCLCSLLSLVEPLWWPRNLQGYSILTVPMTWGGGQSDGWPFLGHDRREQKSKDRSFEPLHAICVLYTPELRDESPGSDTTRIRITIDTHVLCPTFLGWLSILVDPKKPGFWYQQFHTIGKKEDLDRTNPGPKFWDGGISFQRRVDHPDTTSGTKLHGNIRIPLCFWTDTFALINNRHYIPPQRLTLLEQCCPRITNPELQMEHDDGWESRLQLSRGDEAGVDTWLTAPFDVGNLMRSPI
jgi:hypothetical protein